MRTTTKRSQPNLRRNRRRRGRGRKRRNTVSSRISAPRNVIIRNPPSISLNSNICSLWVRGEWNKYDKTPAIHVSLHLQGILDNMTPLKVFNEARVKRINFWFVSRLPITTPGNHSMCVVDDNNSNLKQVTFSIVCASPGSDTRRAYQTLATSWYPTEPSDRDWKPVTSDDDGAICHIYIASSVNASDKENVIDGSLIVDTHISLRGLNTTRLERINNNDSILRVCGSSSGYIPHDIISMSDDSCT